MTLLVIYFTLYSLLIDPAIMQFDFLLYFTTSEHGISFCFIHPDWDWGWWLFSIVSRELSIFLPFIFCFWIHCDSCQFYIFPGRSCFFSDQNVIHGTKNFLSLLRKASDSLIVREITRFLFSFPIVLRMRMIMMMTVANLFYFFRSWLFL